MTPLPPIGDLTRSLLYAELQRLMDRATRVPLFGDEVRWSGLRAGRSETREKAAV